MAGHWRLKACANLCGPLEGASAVRNDTRAVPERRAASKRRRVETTTSPRAAAKRRRRIAPDRAYRRKLRADAQRTAGFPPLPPTSLSRLRALPRAMAFHHRRSPLAPKGATRPCWRASPHAPAPAKDPHRHQTFDRLTRPVRSRNRAASAEAKAPAERAARARAGGAPFQRPC